MKPIGNSGVICHSIQGFYFMELFKKLLIANRGEIAVRIARSAKKLGIKTLAIFAEQDRFSAHLEACDAYCSLGDGSLADTYLNIPKIIHIAQKEGCDAIHPGYGFLSENPAFISACQKAGIAFIGPSEESVRVMGNKVEARKAVSAIGIPILQGQAGMVADILKQSDQLVFPLLVKAAAGGGGKGMRIVHTEKELGQALEAASREALAYFGDPSVYVEHYLEAPRHIEVQIFGDHHGNVVHLFERECSIQRRYQKIIEESPSPTLDENSRNRISSSAVAIAKAMDYRNAGTIEFLLDAKMNHYFLEMNTRIQVEHPVTEFITAKDLVETQILVAAGFPLPFTQDELSISGHAIECRIYAEDPAKHFMPSPGIMSLYKEPAAESVRVDSGIGSSWFVSPDYDPMIAKVISYGFDREQARLRMLEALGKTLVHGIASNVGFLKDILQDDAFRQNRISTKYCDDELDRLLAIPKLPSLTWAIAYLVWWMNTEDSKEDTWSRIGYWRLNPSLTLMVDDIPLQLEFYADGKGRYHVHSEQDINSHIQLLSMDGCHIKFSLSDKHVQAFVSKNGKGAAWVSIDGTTVKIERKDFLIKEEIFSAESNLKGKNPGKITSPMPGKVVKVNVKVGDSVKKGDALLIVEAMKMENTLYAPISGVVESVNIVAGERVDTSKALISVGSPKTDEL